MHTHVTFLGDDFIRSEEKKGIDPIGFGEDLARWMIFRFKGTALKIEPEPFEEDWGWFITASCDSRKFSICIGQYETDGNLGWLCWVESRLLFFKKWFGENDTAEMMRVCSALHSILASATEIREIRWHTVDNFMKGNEAEWKSKPEA